MGTVTRPATGVETLKLSACPCCGGDIEVEDYGYTTPNPGFAKCTGKCKRRWGWKHVEDAWDVGVKWNARAAEIRQNLAVFALLKVHQPVSISRDFHREAMEEKATAMLKTCEEYVIGAVPVSGSGVK